ncbi:hypothetical protein NKH52_29645 [Mesorhizobium sp. M1066]|uniref:hypothetical protein n=1 Tax=unclassified Mesorhizobium TaxID=325217 RepID=UPI00333A25C4
MALSKDLNSVEMTFICSECGLGFVKPGRWFKSAAQHRCYGCHHLTYLSYPKKLALFDRYAKLLTNGAVTGDEWGATAAASIGMRSQATTMFQPVTRSRQNLPLYKPSQKR